MEDAWDDLSGSHASLSGIMLPGSEYVTVMIIEDLDGQAIKGWSS
jgi:hypothetical protein